MPFRVVLYPRQRPLPLEIPEHKLGISPSQLRFSAPILGTANVAAGGYLLPDID